MVGRSGEHINDFLSETIEGVVKALSDSKCITIKDESFE